MMIGSVVGMINDSKICSERLKELEIAWAAGFFDGEGTIVFKRQRYTTVLGQLQEYPAVRISVSQSDAGPLHRFRDAVGYGNVVGPYRNGKLGKKPIYYLSLEGKKALEVMDILLPYLCSPKVKQFKDVLARVKAG